MQRLEMYQHLFIHLIQIMNKKNRIKSFSIHCIVFKDIAIFQLQKHIN